MKRSHLFLLVFISISVSLNAQDDDFMSDDDPPKKWRWRYYPVTEVIQQNGIQVLKVKLETRELYYFEDRVRNQKDFKWARDGVITNYNVPPQKGDSLQVLRPFKKNDISAADWKLPILKAIFIEDKKSYTRTIEFQLPLHSKAIDKGDLVPLEVENKMYNDSLFLFKLDDYQITLMDIGPKPIFPHAKFWTAPAREMESVKIILDDMQQGAAFYRDKVKGAFVSSGPFAGKTASEILDAATEQDVINCLQQMLSNPRPYVGRQIKFTEHYADWIKSGQPVSNNPKLKILLEFKKWNAMRPIEVDADAGKIDGIPIAQLLNNWKANYPWYDGDENEYPERKYPPYYDYSLLGNSLTYIVKEKSLKLLLVSHGYYKISQLKEFTPKEVIQKLGQPARIIGTVSAPKAYMYSRPYGTMEFRFDAFYGVAALVYFYPVKPALVKQAEAED